LENRRSEQVPFRAGFCTSGKQGRSGDKVWEGEYGAILDTHMSVNGKRYLWKLFQEWGGLGIKENDEGHKFKYYLLDKL
jgi:hypothetical protein